MGKILLLLSDFIMSFMWVCSSAVIKIFVNKVLGFGSQPEGDFIRYTLSILNMFFFAVLAKITRGGAYNPLTVLSSAFSGKFSGMLYTFGARIPTQVLGAIVGVRFLIETFPEAGRGPRLNVDIHRGALTEGLLTFAIVLVSQGLGRKDPNSFFLKTWISSLSKLSLHILGADLTGGCMNPASAMGWAFARGDHITMEHVLVYWVAPVHATFLAIWAFKILVPTPKQKRKKIE